MGIIRPGIAVSQADPSQDGYGVAYARRDNVGTGYHGSQKAIQLRCKEYAQACGFQLVVQHFSSKGQGGGNAKYACKNLNGQQFFDKDASEQEIVCPFAINVSDCDDLWKVSRVNFCHNHIKHLGFSSRPVAESTISHPPKDKRNTTQQAKNLTDLVEADMLDFYEGKTEKMTGAAINEFLQGKGFKVSPSTVSRIKRAISDSSGVERLISYQKLESYLALMAEKTPGSLWRFEKATDGTFVRACFLPSIGIRVARMARRLYGFDGAHLKGEMNNYGVFLVATAKDFNNHILPSAFSLVPVENYEHWIWFSNVVREALGDLTRFTVVSDRQKMLLAAVDEVFPEAGHRFCLRRIKSNINSKGVSLTGKERGLINDMARSDCESDYKVFEKELLKQSRLPQRIFKALIRNTGLNANTWNIFTSPRTMKRHPTWRNKRIAGLEMTVAAPNPWMLSLSTSEN